MKKIFIINGLEGGGAERIVLSLCVGFINKGHEVHLILLYNSKSAYAVPAGVKVHYLSSRKPVSLLEKIFFIPKAVLLLPKLLKKIICEEREYLVTSHLPFSNYVCWLAFLDFHFGVIHSTYSKKYAGLKKLFIKILHKRKKIITVSKCVKDDLVLNFSLEADNIRVIYNPVDINELNSLSREKVFVDRPYILHVGRLTSLKRHDILLRAFNREEVYKDYDLIILGEGDQYENIIRLISEQGMQEKVDLHGWEINPYKWIKNASLLILCSDYEGLPTVLIEGIVLKTPVVSTNCSCGPSEILTGELSRYLVPVGDADALAEKMIEALKYYPNITEHHYLRFSLENIVDEYLNLTKIKA